MWVLQYNILELELSNRKILSNVLPAHDSISCELIVQ
uniref:Uncharacterized protein n=1 Tax=Arundo donax TaxID=35708 RepID=A0A0A8ZKJ6_ARUDO